jgi:cobalt/nickel transport system permease protein
MHMADALISPAVGGTMWVATAATTVYCAKKAREDLDESKVPLMAVLGAFIFAAQMLNFAIPGTGSSGHLGGGLILAILLGPYEAFLVIASVLSVQALFFADGGLLALGCNIFNLGFFPAFIAYPFVYKPIVGKDPVPSAWRIVLGSMLAAIVGLQLGAFGVVVETVMSGISELPFITFMLAMLPIHLAIGLVEGGVTATVVLFVRRAQPEILTRAEQGRSLRGVSTRRVVGGFLIAALVAGGAFAWFAASDPDGLEWSIGKVTGKNEPTGVAKGVRDAIAGIQERTAFLPGYGFKQAQETQAAEGAPPKWPAVDAGTTVSGLVGAAITLLLAGVLGWVLVRRSRKRRDPPAASH